MTLGQPWMASFLELCQAIRLVVFLHATVAPGSAQHSSTNFGEREVRFLFLFLAFGACLFHGFLRFAATPCRVDAAENVMKELYLLSPAYRLPLHSPPPNHLGVGTDLDIKVLHDPGSNVLHRLVRERSLARPANMDEVRGAVEHADRTKPEV